MSAVTSGYVQAITSKFFGTVDDECPVCCEKCSEFEYFDGCSHGICSSCISHLEKVCPICREKSKKVISHYEYFKEMCYMIMMDRESFSEEKRRKKNRFSSTFWELMDYLNAIKDEGDEFLKQVNDKVVFNSSKSFKTEVLKIRTTIKLGRDPSANQQDLLNELITDMDPITTSRTCDFIVHMDEEYSQTLKDLCEAQREIKMGHLLKVLALCDNYKGIHTIVTILRRYEPSKIARVMASLFKLPKNGYNETVALLEYHENLEEKKSRAFFDHYYHNQWINHAHYDDETVMDIVEKNGKVVSVYGNDYDRKGRLSYSGYYEDIVYHGHGKQYTEDQNYYEGEFSDGKRNGVFELITERGVQRRDIFVSDKRNGECLEFYNDGETIRERCQYKNGKKNGTAYEMTGSGSLLFKGTYEDDVRVKEGYEFLGPSICRKGTYRNGVLSDSRIMYYPNPSCTFDYEHPVYDKAYYESSPIALGIVNEEVCRLAFTQGGSKMNHATCQEIYIDNMVLGLIQEIRKEYPDCAKPVKESGCKDLIIMGNGIDLIDYDALWEILADCSMLYRVCFQNLKLTNVHMDSGMVTTTINTLVFHKCIFDSASFTAPISVIPQCLRFIDCLNMTRLFIGKSTFSKGNELVIRGCPDLEDIEIEDYNFMDVTSFTLDATMRSLKNLVLGASAFGSCTNLTLRGLPCLETIVMGKNCYKNCLGFCACELKRLKSVAFGDFSFTNGSSLQFLETPSIEAISMGGACFKAINTITFTGAKKFTTFKHRLSIKRRSDLKIEYEDSNPDGLEALNKWFK